MSIDSKESKESVEYNNSSIVNDEEENNINFSKNSRIAKANKDIEAMENNDKVKFYFVNF